MTYIMMRGIAYATEIQIREIKKRVESRASLFILSVVKRVKRQHERHQENVRVIVKGPQLHD